MFVTLQKICWARILITNLNGQITSGIIVETEAYRGPDDRAFSPCYNFRERLEMRRCTDRWLFICIYLLRHSPPLILLPLLKELHMLSDTGSWTLEGLSTMRTWRNGASDNILTKGLALCLRLWGLLNHLMPIHYGSLIQKFPCWMLG